MAYLNNATLTVDAILTKKGRELLAKGQGFNITQFAIADDEVDYTLYTTAHPLGTDYFGSTIENMPVLEASPDETQNLRFKLVTLPRGTKEMPIIVIGYPSIVLAAGQSAPVRPQTNVSGVSSGLNTDGYTAILGDSSAAILTGTGGTGARTTVPTFLSDTQSANAAVATGTEFTLVAKDVDVQKVTTLTIVGNQTGAAITVTVTVNPKAV